MPNYGRAKLVPSLKDSLAKLRTDYVDLTLIHWPAPGNGVAIAEMMAGLMDAREQGLTRQIGISNFPIAETREAIAAVGKDAIATNQIELSPYLQMCIRDRVHAVGGHHQRARPGADALQALSLIHI